MRLLLDANLPHKLRFHLPDHDVAIPREMGWQNLKDRDLLNPAATQGFGALITMDHSMQHQQNLRNHNIAVVLLCAPDNDLDTLRLLVPDL